MSATGVLCARVRLEEKQIIAALGEAGVTAVPVPPASTPLPPGPVSHGMAALGGFQVTTTGDTIRQELSTIIDRCQNRAIAAATLPLLRAQGIRTLDAGLAATGTRLQIASALAGAGIPRPASLAAFSERSGLAAVDHLGCPSTLFALIPGGPTIHLHDRDTADAVIEHRVVLGGDSEAIALLQAGAPADHERAIIHVVGGRAIAMEGVDVGGEGHSLAEAVARVLDASMLAVVVGITGSGLIIWDVLPVGDFRNARLVGEQSVPAAIARLIHPGSCTVHSNGSTAEGDPGERGWEAVVRHGLAISA